jgi:hypothetical protein
MARGAEAKVKVQKQILEAFPGSFLYNDGKEIRIPMPEGGEIVQIKVALTCAKENVEIGADNAMPGDFPAPKMTAPTPQSNTPVQPTEDEKQKVADLLKSLGL